MSLAPPDAAVARTTLPSHHQPLWEDRDDVELVTTVLHGASPIVWPDEIDLLAASLAKLDPTDLVIQAGDCVEDLADATPARTLEKATGLVALGDIARSVTHRVLLAGRIGGQYAKPRSAPFETHAGKTFMTFRGPIVHAPKADERRRAGNVHRIATCWIASEIVTATLRKTPVPGFAADRIWTSHEALLFDYEAPQIREYRGRRYLTSTAWPWVGNRTRTVGSPHLALVWDLVNPVSLKVSGGTDAADLVHIARTLNPRNEAGRLSFIARFGGDRISELAHKNGALVVMDNTFLTYSHLMIYEELLYLLYSQNKLKNGDFSLTLKKSELAKKFKTDITKSATETIKRFYEMQQVKITIFVKDKVEKQMNIIERIEYIVV